MTVILKKAEEMASGEPHAQSNETDKLEKVLGTAGVLHLKEKFVSEKVYSYGTFVYTRTCSYVTSFCK